jgi:hypothetical protein
MFPPTNQGAPQPGAPMPPTAPQTGQDPTQSGMELVDEGQIIAEVNTFVESKFQDRRPYEMQWYLNGLGVRTGGDAKMNPVYQRLEQLTKEPAHRKRYRINRIRVKFLAKVAKYTNSRPRPVVLPASTDRDDVLDARFTEYFLKYLHESLDLEAKYEETVNWAEITGKAFWALRWDASAIGRIRDPRTQKPVEAVMGDVAVDVTDAFQILVDDPGVQTLGRQRKMARVRVELLADVETRYQLQPGVLEGDTSGDDLFQFQKQIADIGAQYATGGSMFVQRARSGRVSTTNGKKNDFVLVKEFFEAPSGKYPKGRMAVVAGGKLLKYNEQLPYGFWTFKSNPFPFVEFAAGINPGQFWPTTMVEQLLSLQEQYSTFRSKLIEQLSLAMHPKLLVPRNAKIAESAYNSEPNEKIYYTALPGMPEPRWQQPPSVSMDAWRLFDTLRTEMDEVSNIYPSSLGGQGGAESGFQTNLLQDAADAVFGPDTRRMERAWVEALKKIRRIAAIGYDVERLISIGSKGLLPAVFEFSNANIDEAAEIKVQIGSALPDQKAARLKAVLELKASGMFDNGQNDPRVNRALLELADLDGLQSEVDPQYTDAENARLENQLAERGGKLPPPAPWDDNPVHVNYHEETLKSPQFQTWPPPAKMELIRHYVFHLQEADVVKAFKTAKLFAQQDPVLAQLLPQLFQQVQSLAQGGAPAPGGPPQGHPAAPPSGGGQQPPPAA